MDALDIVLAVLKFVGITAALVFGVIAINYDFKDDDGKVTRAGWVGISGVFVAALLAAGSHTVEVLKARRDADEASKKAMNDLAQSRQLLNSVSKTTKTSEQMLHQVQRSLELIDLNDLRVDFCLEFSIDDPAFDAYKTRLEAKCAELRNELDNSGKVYAVDLDDNLKLFRVPMLKKGGQALHILRVGAGSTLWPDRESPEEKSAAMMVGRCAMILEFSNPSYPDPNYVMEMMMGGTLDGTPGPKPFKPIHGEMSYYPGSRTLAVRGGGAETVGIPEPTTNAFLSIVDFERAKVRITLTNGEEHTRLVPSVLLRSFSVSFGEKLRSVTGCGDVQKVESEDGLTFFVTLSRG